MSELNRRRFITDSSTLAAGAVAAGQLSEAQADAAESQTAGEFASDWSRCGDRIWLGAEYWSNPLQDWQLAHGRIECINASLDRNVHLLTRGLGSGDGELNMQIRVGRMDGAVGQGRGSLGFRIGINGPLKEYRNSLIFGSGMDCGLTATGRLFIGNPNSAEKGAVDLKNLNEVELRLTAQPHRKAYRVTLAVYDPTGGEELGKVTRDDVPATALVGNLALVANYGTPRRGNNNQAAGHGAGKFWFADWNLTGSKLEAHEDHTFGPILFAQYTLSGKILKLTAQMPPLGADDSQTVKLLVKQDGEDWTPIGEEKIHPDARTATFEVQGWDDTRAADYRLAYSLRFKDGPAQEHTFEGTIRRDPVDKPVVTVADVSCNIHAAFPNHQYTANLAKLDPDLLAFTGDQFYESTGGYGVVRKPVERAIVDYLRKWYIHGWTWRELMRDRPSISIPDDHDVYQGNIWGEKGAPQQGTQEAGGYNMHPRWVNVVHRTQTSHHPRPFDGEPIRQEISVYHGGMTYGRISFAILADRMFKTAPEGNVPPTGTRADHVIDPNFDPKTADLPGLELLGQRQKKFLEHWVNDWAGADMKAVVSQTIFTAMATTHGGGRDVLRADYDTNGWPQTARNDALRLIRKAFPVHLAGDQHLPAVVHYGVDEHNDAGIAFAGPAVNVGYPRWWEPKLKGKNRQPGAPEITGQFEDHFGNLMTVLAVANGVEKPSGPILDVMRQKSSGLGVVRFDKAKREITIECWPYLADPTQPDTQFAGWPVKFSMFKNYARTPAAHLPKIRVSGMQDPVLQVFDDKTGELVYALRISGSKFQPHVFAEGEYTVRVSDPETGKQKKLSGLQATAKNNEVVDVTI